MNGHRRLSCLHVLPEQHLPVTTGDEKGELDGPLLDKSGHFSSSSGHGGSVQHTSTPAFGVHQ